MNRKNLLILLFALTAGLLLGNAGKYMRNDSPESSPAGDENCTTVSPRPGTAPDTSSGPRRPSAKKTSSPTLELDRQILSYSRMNPEEMWDELTRLCKTGRHYSSQDTMQDIRLLYLCTRLGEKAPRQTLQQIGELEKKRYDLKINVLKAWGEKDPEAVAAYCQEKMKEDPYMESQMKVLYTNLLLKSSPEKALAWLATLPPAERSISMYSVLPVLIKKPETMEAVLEKSGFDIRNDKGSSQKLAAQLAEKDWDAARRWIDTLPENSRTDALAFAVGSLPLDKAASKIHLLGEQEKEQALIQLVSSNIHGGPSAQKTLEWLATNIEEKQAAKMVEKRFYGNMSYDSNLSSYIERMPAGELKDTALKKMISSLSSSSSNNDFRNTEIEEVFSFANKIGSKEKRDDTIEDVLNSWARKEPEKVRTLTEQSDLTPEKKKELGERCDQFIKNK